MGVQDRARVHAWLEEVDRSRAKCLRRERDPLDGKRWEQSLERTNFDPRTGEVLAPVLDWKPVPHLTRLVASEQKGLTMGLETHTPLCPTCSTATVWRGRWDCPACQRRVSWSVLCGLGPMPSDLPQGSDRATVKRAPLFLAASVAPRIFSSPQESNCSSSPNDSRIQWGQWLDAVETQTSWWRRDRAARFRRKSWSAWHRDRERGQAERFDRVRACGTVEYFLQKWTPGGALLGEIPMRQRCGCWRVCKSCLTRRRLRLQKGLETQRVEAFKQRKAEMRERYRGPEGRWQERMLTLTVPHGEDGPAADAKLLTKAWRVFYRRILEHLQQDRGMAHLEKKRWVWDGQQPVWVRAMEVEPGGDGGHAHLHIWMLSPYLEGVWLHATWGRVLESFGRECPQKPWAEAMAYAKDTRTAEWCRTRRGVHGRQPVALPWPHVYVNTFDAHKNTAKEAGEYVVKVGVQHASYVLKGTKKELVGRLNPVHVASVYQALESARCVQWARGWAPKKVKQDVVWRMRRATQDERDAAVQGRQAPATTGDTSHSVTSPKGRKDGHMLPSLTWAEAFPLSTLPP